MFSTARGLRRARVVASGDLDEHEIVRLKEAGASIDISGGSVPV